MYKFLTEKSGTDTRFFYKKNFHTKMSPKNLKKISSLKCLSCNFFPRALYKLQKLVNFSIFSHLKFLSVFINGSNIHC